MRTGELLRHAAYIGRHQNKDFEWGKNDCLTFLFGWVDAVFGEKQQSKIRGKYYDIRSAVKFWREFPMSVKQWMTLRGFEQTDGEYAREGDVRIIETAYPSAFIFHNGAWWQCSEGEGVKPYNLKWAKDFTHWRRT